MEGALPTFTCWSVSINSIQLFKALTFRSPRTISPVGINGFSRKIVAIGVFAVFTVCRLSQSELRSLLRHHWLLASSLTWFPLQVCSPCKHPQPQSQNQGYSSGPFLSPKVQSTLMYPPGLMIGPQGCFLYTFVGQEGTYLIPTIIKGTELYLYHPSYKPLSL